MLQVLLVDDDSEFTEVACQIIEFIGHDVCVASNLKEAKEWLNQQKFDHVLLDFMLPDGSGLHLIDFLHQNHLTPYITLITGHTK